MVSLRSSALLLSALASLVACTTEVGDDEEPAASTTGELAKLDGAHWIYDGPMPALTNPRVTVSLAGHTLRLEGTFQGSISTFAGMPHVKTKRNNGVVRVQAVYPIATAAAGYPNPAARTTAIVSAFGYRPKDDVANWGGFPFMNYQGGIAMHGPITASGSNASVWYLQRGRVSHGCNRMLGEHVTEVAHALGINMRTIWDVNPGRSGRQAGRNPSSSQWREAPVPTVTVIDGYDDLEGKPVDIDYPAYGDDPGDAPAKSMERPAGSTMFTAWIASESDTGQDLPGSGKWEAGVSGKPYVFSDAKRLRRGWVCSIPKQDIDAVFTWLGGREVPRGFCRNEAVKRCYLQAARDGVPVATAATRCDP